MDNRQILKRFINNSLKGIKAFTTWRLEIEADRIPYTFENISYKKLINASLTELSILLKPTKPWGMPTHVMIEPTAFCNLRCALCPVTSGLNRPQGHMEIELFKRIIDEIGDYIFHLLLWDWGEPFLNPHIYDMISYAKEKGVKIISSTNGMVFENEKQAERLVLSGIDTIIFAIDGISQKTYQAYRQGGDLHRVIQGIKNVISKKRELNVETPLVNFRFIVMQHNEHEIPELKKLAKALQVDALTLKTLNAAAQDPYFEIKSDKREDYTDFLPKNTKYRRFKFRSKGLSSIRHKNNPCKQLWNHPSIHWSGKISPCTYDPQEKYVLGDLSVNSFKEIWYGDKYRDMRRRFRNNWEQINLCNECSYAYVGGDCSCETIAEAFFY